MQGPRKLIKFLNIHPGEEGLIAYLVLLAFLLDLAFVLIQSAAFGVFLAEYGPQALPYSYIAIAVFASLAALLYIKLGERVSFSAALLLNLSTLAIFGFLIWLGLKSSFAHPVSFLLPLTYQIISNLGTLVLWQLAGRILNFGQAKRLFPLLSAGGWLASILGGILVVPLVDWIGADNLLLPGSIVLVCATLTVRAATRSHLSEEPARRQPRRVNSTAPPAPGFLRNPYVLLIFAYISLWWIAFFFLDNIFADQVTAQFPDANQLTAFRGQFSAFTGVVALFSSMIMTGWVIRRFGLRVALIAEPLLVTLSVALFTFYGSFNTNLLVLFLLTALAKLINVSLGWSLSQSGYNIVFQPLPDRIRGRVQATSDGIFQAIASGLAGISLLVLTTVFKFTSLGLAYAYIGVGITLLLVILVLSNRYISALAQAITKRRLGESPGVIADPASIALLESRLSDPHPGVALYSLNKLAALDEQVIVKALPGLVCHPAPEVRQEAFSWIETLRLRTALDPVKRQLAIETIPAVKEHALRALGAIADDQSYSLLTDTLNITEFHTQRGALVSLLKYHRSQEAEQTLDQLLGSASSNDRVLAAQVLGEADRTHFVEAHRALLHDPDLTVRREAILSVAKSRQPMLYPVLIEACDFPETSRAAARALIDIGQEVFPEIETAFLQSDRPRQRLLVLSKVLARIGGAFARTPLHSRIYSANAELRTQILNSLTECGYHTKNRSEVYLAIKLEIEPMVWACAAQTDLGNSERTALLSGALDQFCTQTRDRVLLLLSFAFDAYSILRVRDSLLAGSSSYLPYALEILDTQLPAKWKPMILPLIENLSAQERLQRLAILFPQAHESSEQRLWALIASMEFTKWIRGCAIHAAGELRASACYELIQDASGESDPFIRETARWALAQFSTAGQEGKASMLSTIEKVLILKTVDMFNQTPDNVLADVADLLEEMEVPENETIFNQGDPGDSMYIIVDGKVRVHDGERLLNYLGESDVFGEMALLDPEPRLASVTAVEATRLFRLDQAPFYELMAERPEVATGIIRVLTGHLRNRVQDIAQLHARITELENARPA